MKRRVLIGLAAAVIAVGAAVGLPAALADSGGGDGSPVSASVSTVIGCVFVDGGCASTPSNSLSLPINSFAAVGLCATNDSGVPYPVGSEQFQTTFGTLYNGDGAGSANDPGDAVGPTATDDTGNPSGPRNEIHGGNIANVRQPQDCYYVVVGSSVPGTATVSATADGVALDSTVRVSFHS